MYSLFVEILLAVTICSDSVHCLLMVYHAFANEK